ncbi:Cna B-type domain-containing protein [Dellaglioa algida]|uniref:Cna B-type domain-containing protein n=1 Tax=Dellaglioa algida TaxID=105612 RepID=UPI0024C48417|nr:Cna B-type domain-containing protein [Dellaglioa algida]MDK1725647.1 Cna B-type domain-containing protein [Dellaglioa algida]MDK1739652.1 Cna B-type domain-containing protein [Dellaglioa algida]
MNKKIRTYFILLGLLTSFCITPATAYAEATHGDVVTQQAKVNNDVSHMVTDLKLSTNRMVDGGKATVRLEFNAQGRKIKAGDIITVNWPHSGNVFGTGYAKTYKFKIHNVDVGTLTVTKEKAVILFDHNIEDMSDVKGWTEFDLEGRNMTEMDDKNIGNLIITSGNQSAKISIEKPATKPTKNSFYYKSGDMQPEDTSHVRWFLNINNNKNFATDGVDIDDKIQPGQKLDLDNFEISVNGYNHSCFLGKGAVEKFTKVFQGSSISADPETGQIKVFIPERWVSKNTFKIKYLTKIQDYNQKSFENKSKIWYREFNQPAVSGKESNATVKNVNVDGKIDGENKTIASVTKKWDDHDNQDGLRPEKVTAQLYANGNKTGDPVTLEAANQWHYSWKGLVKSVNGSEIIYTVGETSQTDGYIPEVTTQDASENEFVITNQHESETTDVSGEKTWVDNEDKDGQRPESIKIHLLANGKQEGPEKMVKASENWQYKFRNVPKYANGKLIQYTVSENAAEDYTGKVDGMNIENTYTPTKTSVTVIKKWVDHNNQDGIRSDDVKVQLYADGKEKGNPVELNEDNHWTGHWLNLNKNENGTKIKYSVKELNVSNQYRADISNADATENDFLITNTHKPELTAISGTKTWVDNDDQDGKRPSAIQVHLLANSQRVGVTKKVTAAENWQYTFNDMPKCENGQLIHYSVVEDNVVGYTPEVSGFNLINRYTPEKTAVQVTKKWADHNNQDGMRPDKVQIQLYADDKAQGDIVELNEANHWLYQWTGLDKKLKGSKVNYSVKEVAISKQYKSAVSVVNEEKNEFTITNSHKTELTDISGNKTWLDDNDRDGKRPEMIKVHLLANGKQVGDAKSVSAKDDWKYSFKDMPKYENGKVIEYTISEDSVSGYTSKVDGNDLINKHESELTSISGHKTWLDNDNQDGKRPETIKVHLLANGKQVGDAKSVSAKDDWKYSFKDMPKYENGKVIEYAISEDSVSGYTSKVDGNDLINKHESELTSVLGTKTWLDNNNQDGKRPEMIKVHLLANGKQVGDAKSVSAKDDWKYSFKDMPKYENGKVIEYAISEDSVSGYTSKVDGNDLINSYTPGKVAVQVTKKWEDQNNQDGVRPDKVRVQLYADGKPQGNGVELNESNHWIHHWTDLNEKVKGTKVTYDVKELNVSKLYQSAVSVVNKEKNEFLITNSHKVELTSVSGHKTWLDDNNQDGKRPETIKIHLLANGKQVGDAKLVSAKDDWKYSFKDMPKYENGKAIEYTISEGSVVGYTSKVDGTNLINQHKSELTSVSGHKTWLDDNNQDGKRPETIKIHLLANGKQVGDVKSVSSKDDWKYSFKDMPKYENGKVIEYTISEDSVVGYTSKVDGNNLINKHESELTSVSGHKTWLDNDNQDGKRPETIKIHLLANGKQVGDVKSVSSKDGWKYSFKDMPKYENGKAIEYTISEDSVPGYASKVDGTNLINSYIPKRTIIQVTKKWDDQNNQDGVRPDKVWVQLYANGKTQGEVVELSEANHWIHRWTDLNEKSKGVKNSYSVKELNVAHQYKSLTSIMNKSNNELLITNRHEVELITISGTKTWLDDNNRDGKRPGTIKVHLSANGKQVGDAKSVSAKDDWKYSFKDMPKYENGKVIEYMISENSVSGYTSKVDGNNLINKHNVELTDISGHKTWLDDNNRDGKRPETIKVHLLANGKQVGDVKIVSSKDDWKYSFKDMPKYENGKVIEYTISENSVSGYTSKVNGNNLINKHNVELTDISGHKTWSDDNDRDGKRPGTIKVHLLANGKKVGDVKSVSAKDDWKYSFKDMPKYENGKVIEYTISEDSVSGYTSKVDGNNLINEHEPDKTTIHVIKKWDDYDNQSGLRPGQVKVQLYADDKAYGEVVELNANNQWAYSWQELYLRNDGKKVTYTVREVETDKAYSADVKEMAPDHFEITNTLIRSLTPDKPEKKPTKRDSVKKEPVKKVTAKKESKQIEVVKKEITKKEVMKPKATKVNSVPKKPTQKQLPKTGEEENNWVTIFGILVVLLSGGCYFYGNRKRKVTK